MFRHMSLDRMMRIAMTAGISCTRSGLDPDQAMQAAGAAPCTEGSQTACCWPAPPSPSITAQLSIYSVGRLHLPGHSVDAAEEKAPLRYEPAAPSCRPHTAIPRAKLCRTPERPAYGMSRSTGPDQPEDSWFLPASVCQPVTARCKPGLITGARPGGLQSGAA